MTLRATPLPIDPIPQLGDWAGSLRAISEKPLDLCPDFPEIADRFEAWWKNSYIDRPIFIASARQKGARPASRNLDLLAQPERWLEAKKAELQTTTLIGDALPTIRVDFGPVMLGGLLGAPVEFLADTTWTRSYIDDEWSNAPDWRISPDNEWWKLLGELTTMVAREAKGRFLLRTPDLGGSADVLLNLRGSEPLCLDAIERPDQVEAAIDAIYPSWRQAWRELYGRTLVEGTGLVHWLGIWSDRPYLIPACDFSFMIGPRQFEALFLSDIARQTATVGRGVFHLDGPGATRHLDLILDVPGMKAIQFTPGEGTPSALAWLPMLRRIQERGRSLYIIAPAAEVIELAESLSPDGLAIRVAGGIDECELRDLFAQFSKLYHE